jgi:hypothetical protein
MPRAEWYESRFKMAREEAQEAMKRAQGLWQKETKFKAYQKDDQAYQPERPSQMPRAEWYKSRFKKA